MVAPPKNLTKSGCQELIDEEIISLKPFSEVLPELVANIERDRNCEFTILTYRYAVELSEDNNGTWLITVPDIPEVVTFGFSPADALERAADAIQTALIGYVAAKEAFPESRTVAANYVTIQIKQPPA